MYTDRKSVATEVRPGIEYKEMITFARRLLLVWGVALIAFCIFWLSRYPNELYIASVAGDSDNAWLILQQLIPHQIWDVALGVLLVALSIMAKRNAKRSMLLALLVLVAPIFVAGILLSDRAFSPVFHLNFNADPPLSPLTKMFLVLIPYARVGIDSTIEELSGILGLAALSMWVVPLINCLVFLPCAGAAFAAFRIPADVAAEPAELPNAPSN